MNERLDVLVVDDEPLIRKGIMNLLEKRSDIGQVYEASNGFVAQDILKRTDVQLVFADIRMPKMDGIELINWISINRPHIKTVVLSAYQDFEYAKKTFLFGTLDYLLKHEIDEQQLEAVLHKVKDSIAEDRNRDCDKTRRMLIDGTVPENERNEKGRVVCIEVRDAACRRALLDFAEKSGLQAVFENKLFYGIVPCLDTDFVGGVPGYRCGFSKEMTLWKIDEMKRQARVALGDCFFSEKNSAVYLPQMEPVGDLRRLAEIRNSFFECCADKNTAGLITCMQRICDVVREEVYDSDGIKLFYTSLFELLTFQYAAILSEEYTPETIGAKIDCAESFCALHGMLAECVQYIANKSINIVEMDACSGAVKSALAYINLHYADKDIGLDTVARELGYAAAYLSRIFKRETAVGVVDYINGVRILHAARLLESHKAGDVAFMVGYNNYNYFNKNFRKIMGVSPSEYK